MAPLRERWEGFTSERGRATLPSIDIWRLACETCPKVYRTEKRATENEAISREHKESEQTVESIWHSVKDARTRVKERYNKSDFRENCKIKSARLQDLKWWAQN
eukprot:357877_1